MSSTNMSFEMQILHVMLCVAHRLLYKLYSRESPWETDAGSPLARRERIERGSCNLKSLKIDELRPINLRFRIRPPINAYCLNRFSANGFCQSQAESMSTSTIRFGSLQPEHACQEPEHMVCSLNVNGRQSFRSTKNCNACCCFC